MKSMPEGYEIVVTEFYSNDGIKYSCRSKGSDVGAANLHDKLWFQDTSASDVAYVRVILYNDKGDMVDRREVRMKLNTNGVFEANRDFLAYIYYGTDGTGGAQYTNKRISTMEGNYSTLKSRMTTAEGDIKKNTQKITETADEYSRQLTQEKNDREGAVSKLQTSIEATASGIRTTVQSLYKEGNLLTGGDVRGSRAKRYQAYVSPVTTHLKKGITYTVTARMWLEAKDDYPTQPKMDGHFMTMYVFTEDWETEWSHSYTYTKSGTVVDSFSFTPESDIDVLVSIYEQNSEGPDPKEYGGVSVNWVRLDMGDRTGEKQIIKWTPSAGDVEARNLIPDPNFEVSSWETTDGASSRGKEGDVSFMSRYTDDYEDYGFRGVRMTRSGYTGKDGNSDGLIYYIPFRGEGDYTLQAFFKDLNGVTLDDAAFIEVHPADVNQRRICYGFSFGLFRRTDETGYFRVSRAYHFGKTATNAASGVSQEIRWLEVRVFLTRNGDVVVSRMSLAKCGHAVHWNANALGSENGRTLSMESYVDQRANSLEADIRKGLQSVGFRMDGETWSVNTWGNLFAWYANEKDAKAGNTGNAVMYMAQDNGTWTLHVKGYVEATGGTIGGLKLAADGLYQGTENTMRYSYYSNDSMYLRGFRASTNNASTFHIALGWPSVTNPDGSITARSIGYANHGLNGAMEVVRKTKGSSNTLKLRGSGQIEPGDATVYEGDNECALGIRCGDSNTGYGYGIVNIGMLATHRITVLTGKGSSNVKLQTEGFYIATGNGMKITMPDNPQNGAVVCVVQQCDGRINFDGNGKKFKYGNDSTSTAYSGTAGQWNFFLFYSDGYNKDYWHCSYFRGKLW